MRLILRFVIKIIPITLYFAYRLPVYREANKLIWYDMVISGLLLILGDRIAKIVISDNKG